MFVWVKDPATGHQFDVPENDWRLDAGIFTRIKEDRYPPVARPRQAKFNTTRKKAAVAVESMKEPTNG
jgi:hypothetical protein